MMAVAIGLVLHSLATEASGHWPGLGSIDEFHNRTGPWVEKRRWCFAFCMCGGNCIAWIEFAEKKLVVPHTLSVWAASKVNCELGKKSLV